MKKSFHEVFGPPENIFMINEIFDTSVKVKFKSVGSAREGRVTVNEKDYKISLEPLTYTIEKKVYTIINLSFEIWDEEKKDWTTSFQDSNQASSKLMGIVYNAWLQELKTVDYDALWFAAKDKIEKRMNIYNFIAKRYMQLDLGGGIKENIKIQNGKLTILFGPNYGKISKKDRNKIDKFIEDEANKKL